MTNGGSAPNTMLITLVIVALVVVRFLFRELRARKVTLRLLWVRPGILLVFTLLAIAAAFATPGVNVAILLLSVAGGAVVGVVTGALVARSTTFSPAGERGAVIAQGSIVTVIIWVVAILLRFAARYAFADAGANLAAQFELNAGLLALVAAAFVVVALAFHRAIDRLGPDVPSSSAVSRTL